jgi:hypothetical protein
MWPEHGDIKGYIRDTSLAGALKRYALAVVKMLRTSPCRCAVTRSVRLSCLGDPLHCAGKKITKSIM